MPAYVILTREKTRNEVKLNGISTASSGQLSKAPWQISRHPRPPGSPGSSAIEEIVILEFPTFADATAWYHGPEYQAAREHRFQGGDYRCIITRGLPT